MPGERLTLRSTSEIGRFPGAAPPTRVELTIQKVEERKQEEGGCRRWFRKICPCCCKRQTSTSYDVTEKIEYTKEPTPEPIKPNPENGETKETEEVTLSVCSVDLWSSKTGQNRVEHHTDLYHGNDLIIRRGQTFQMEMELNRTFNADTDKMHLELKTGLLPKVSKMTHVIIPLVEHLEDERWEAKITEQKGNKIKLSVNSPANAVIGLYELTVMTRSLDEVPTAHNSSKNVIILFNPWCEEDAVFLDDEEQRKEYVLNDTGRIYYGTEKQIGSRTWNFGQFHEGVLEACLFILEKSDMPPSGRGDPVNVVRVLSALINAQDDYGVLVGNWSGDYSEGVSPSAWSSSVEILRKYHSTNGIPVKYGQCWVFSGVTTTMLRCLGIPVRSVTNFQSAHDTDVSLTTDVYFDENLEPIDYLNSDSVWNFHVWNDCWMTRPDLPPGNGGWQAVDSTPQETSQGIFCCGPASISAIRSGHVYLKHDTPFVFAEVNSDKIYWKRNQDGTFSQIFSEKKAVGHCISTKAVGSDEREDITLLYKHPEDSEEERISVETASRYGSKPDVYCAPAAEDVHVEVKIDGEGPKMGCDAKLSIVVKNLSSEPRQTTLHSQVAVMHYTGVLKNAIKKDQIPIELLPNEEKNIEWILPYQQYKNQLVDQAALMLSLCGRVTETKQVLANQTSFRLRTPDLNITPLGDAVVGKEMSAKINFTNPLPCTLKDVVFRVEGLGLQKGHEVIVGDVGSHATVTLTERFIPYQPGPRKLVASLDCKQLTQVHGVADIVVLEQ
ncbi:protein-glutamine gamma-glutamyltransferase K [Nematolebias whitei]|uniref:protein-glutamine gamma-glutamyltransferase K n=1 Tax=Nematolebias whitei TaxID=451745 RepID=UPI00189A7C3C|nr:protein-glutamine gamma-glutamyltransferase K [Nematolebias whitei]